MLVKCDKCGQGYEVNESRLSPQGARIKCPACAHIFLVRLNDGKAAVSSSPTPAPTSDTPSLTSGAAATNAAEEETWRVRHIGLTYTFHDLTSLQDWLNSKPSLADVKIAKGEDDWHELGDYPNVMTTELITKFFPLGDVPKSDTKDKGLTNAVSDAVGGTGAFDDLHSTPSLPLNNDPVSTQSDLSTVINAVPKKNARQLKAERAAEAERKKTINRNIIAISVIVLIIAAVAIYFLLFARYGKTVMDYIPKDEAPVAAEKTTDLGVTPEDLKEIHKTDPEDIAQKIENPDAVIDAPKLPSDEELREMAEAEIQARFDEAKALVKDRKWPEARATLETLVKDRPEHIETLQLLQQTYRGLGLNTEASALDATIKKLKAEAKKKADEEAKAEKAANK